ncbi:Heat stress transcription factor B-2a [Abeliophyllum distichum]|uniref:Heat stress transcription factor B-2a n=1 Tax=Abeliophyllum distichum TaxID=126358 RepID=A0ABD1SY20_9LAMI
MTTQFVTLSPGIKMDLHLSYGILRNLQEIYSQDISSTTISRVVSVNSILTKVVPDRWEFLNKWFQRSEKKLLCDIQRQKIATTSSAMVATLLTAVTVAIVPLTPATTQQRTVSSSDLGKEQVLSSYNSAAAVPSLAEAHRS